MTNDAEVDLRNPIDADFASTIDKSACEEIVGDDKKILCGGEVIGPPITWSALDYIQEYADAALVELQKWVDWHKDRAQRRGLPKQWGLDAVSIAAWNIYDDLACHADDAQIDLSEEALHRVITNTKAAGWRASLPFENGSPEAIMRDDQAIEVDEGALRGWARVMCSMAECFKFARENPDQERRWCHEAAHELALCCPPKLRETENCAE